MSWKPADRAYGPDVDGIELRHQVIFLEPTTVTDESGVSTDWAAGNPPQTAYAKIETISAADVIKGGQDVSQVRINVTVRYRPDRNITAGMRLQLPDGSVLMIEGTPENLAGDNRYLVLTCLGVGDNG